LNFEFEVPRTFVNIDTPASPANSRPSQTGTWRGGGAPSTDAMYGSHSDTGAGSSSDTL
jgi:hypothetical protein